MTNPLLIHLSTTDKWQDSAKISILPILSTMLLVHLNTVYELSSSLEFILYT